MLILELITKAVTTNYSWENVGTMGLMNYESKFNQWCFMDIYTWIQ